MTKLSPEQTADLGPKGRNRPKRCRKCVFGFPNGCKLTFGKSHFWPFWEKPISVLAKADFALRHKAVAVTVPDSASCIVMARLDKWQGGAAIAVHLAVRAVSLYAGGGGGG